MFSILGVLNFIQARWQGTFTGFEVVDMEVQAGTQCLSFGEATGGSRHSLQEECITDKFPSLSQVVYGALASVPVDVGVAFTSRVDPPRLGQACLRLQLCLHALYLRPFPLHPSPGIVHQILSFTVLYNPRLMT